MSDMFGVSESILGADYQSPSYRLVGQTSPFNVQTYGSVADGVTDARSAFAAADVMAVGAGQAVYVPAGTYRIASNVVLGAPCLFAAGAIVKPDAGITVTFSAPIRAIVGRLFDLSAGGKVTCWKQDVAYPEWWGIVGDDTTKATANTVAFPKMLASMAPDTATSSGGQLVWGPRVYSWSDTCHYNRCVMSIGAGGGAYSATVFSFPDGKDGVVFHAYHTAPDGTGTAQNAELRDIQSVAVAKTLGTGSGFFMKARVILRQCLANGFGLDGFHTVASVAATPATNANMFLYDGCVAGNCTRHGFYTQGSDVNAGSMRLCQASLNGGTGFWDQSFLGNTYVACLTEGNGQAYNIIGANAQSLLLGCYSESGQGLSHVEYPSVMVGGTHGTGFDATTTGGRWTVSNAGWQHWPNLLVANEGSGLTHKTTMQVGAQDALNTLAAMSSDDDNSGVGYVLRYDIPATGWYGWIHANGAGLEAFALGGAAAVDASGQSARGYPWFPNGYFAGRSDQGNMRKRTVAAAAPTTGKWCQGDIVWNSAPISGGTIGWVCTTTGDFAATPPTFKTFGAIA